MPQMNVWIIYRRDRFLRGSDNGPFLDQRYPAVRLTEPNEDYRHEHQNVRVENGVQFGDLAQFVDFNYTANVTRVNLASLAALADGPAAPQGVRVEAATLTVDTTLLWQPNTEPDLAGYEIVYRATNMPYWQHDSSRQRHELHRAGNHEGQLHLRCARRRPGRQPQRRDLPGSGHLAGARGARSAGRPASRSRESSRGARTCDLRADGFREERRGGGGRPQDSGRARFRGRDAGLPGAPDPDEPVRAPGAARRLPRPRRGRLRGGVPAPGARGDRRDPRRGADAGRRRRDRALPPRSARRPRAAPAIASRHSRPPGAALRRGGRGAGPRASR